MAQHLSVSKALKINPLIKRQAGAGAAASRGAAQPVGSAEAESVGVLLTEGTQSPKEND